MPNTTQLLLYEETIMHNDHAISSKCVLCHILHSKFCLCYYTRQFLLFHRFRSWLTKCSYRTISKKILFFKTCQKLLFIRTWPTRQVLILETSKNIEHYDILHGVWGWWLRIVSGAVHIWWGQHNFFPSIQTPTFSHDLRLSLEHDFNSDIF